MKIIKIIKNSDENPTGTSRDGKLDDQADLEQSWLQEFERYHAK